MNRSDYQKQLREGLNTVYGLHYASHERYVYGWTDPRGIFTDTEKVPDKVPLDMSTDFLTNFMGMVIIMIPVSVIAYWIWF